MELNNSEELLLKKAMEPQILWTIVDDVVAPVCTECIDGTHINFGYDHRSNDPEAKGRRGCKNSDGKIQCNCSQDWGSLFTDIEDENLILFQSEYEAKQMLLTKQKNNF